MAKETFDRLCVITGQCPLTDVELQRNAPDLPLSIGCLEHASWAGLANASILEIADMLLDSRIDPVAELPTDSLALAPMTKTGRFAAGLKVIHAAGSCYVSVAELVWHAARIQGRLDGVEGCGLHRLGSIGRIASYYIWGFRDKAL